MKLTRLLAIILLISCENSVRFEVPQPEGKQDEKRIPRILIGRYLNIKDSSILIVASHLITHVAVADLSEHKSQLDSADSAIYQNDTTLSQTDSKMRMNVVVRGDSVFWHMDYRDTIFSLDRGDRLRKLKGYYFLNYQTSENSWNVTKVTKGRDGLILGTVSNIEDIQNLRELTEEASDTVYNFRPTKKELKKFLKNDGFNDTDTYIRIR